MYSSHSYNSIAVNRSTVYDEYGCKLSGTVGTFFNKVGVVHKSDRNLVSKERLHPNGTMPLLGESDSG